MTRVRSRSLNPGRCALAAALLVAGAMTVGCSDDDPRPGGPGTVTQTGTGTGTGGMAGSGGTVGGGGTGGTAGGTGGTGLQGEGELGPIEHQDIPDTPCLPRGGTTVELYPSGPGGPNFPQLVMVGSRRAAGEDGTWRGLVTFDADGSNADPSATTVGSWDQKLGSEGATAALAANTSGGDLVYQRFSDTAAPIGSELVVAAGAMTDLIRIASGEGESLVVWASSGTIQARGVNAAGELAGPAFDIQVGAYNTAITMAAARRPGGFAVVWSGDDVHSQEFATGFALATISGLSGSPVEITRTPDAPGVAGLGKTPSGYALLINGPVTTSPYVLLLDDSGGLTSPAYRLVGALYSLDIAIQGSEIGVLAPRATAETEFRPFDADMTPLGDWVCMDAPSNLSSLGGLDTDGSGYAAVYFRAGALPLGTQIFTQFDRLGTGP